MVQMTIKYKQFVMYRNSHIENVKISRVRIKKEKNYENQKLLYHVPDF